MLNARFVTTVIMKMKI